MDNREIAIRLSGVKKMYRLGQIGGGTLTADLQSWWARIRGKEDPNTIIGTDQRLAGQTFMALNGIDLTVYKGEALGIIGSNGAGKSTMLKLLSRVTAPSEGEIGINGRIASMLEVGTGFNPEMTGRENVYLNGAILGMTKAEIDAKMEDIIEFSEVRDFIDTPVKRYSSGMYVKLAFSVAAHLDSEIMIMDEVLAVGDIAFQRKCLNKMRDASKKEGRTVLYVSHNMNTIRQLCDRCVVLDKGRVAFVGDVEEAIHKYMNTNRTLSLVHDCSGDRGDIPADKSIHIDKVIFVNTDFPIYQSGDLLCIKVEYTGKINISNLAFRMTVQSGDRTAIGLATSKPCVDASEGRNTVYLSLNLDCLAPGKYTVKLTAYSVNEFGSNLMHDIVEGCFSFEKVQSLDDNNRMIWNHTWWGYMMFPELGVGFE